MPGSPSVSPYQNTPIPPSTATRPTRNFPGRSKPSKPKGPNVAPEPMNIQGIQRHLRKQGYKVTVSGQMDDTTKSALADYLQVKKGSKLAPQMAKALKGVIITGRRNVRAWNRNNAALKPDGKPTKPTSSVPGPRNSSHPDGQYTVPPKSGSGGGGNNTVVTVPAAAPGASYTPYAGPPMGAQLLNPATHMAGLDAGYSPVIEGLRREMAARERASIANADETRGWYDQVVGSLRKAGSRDREINVAAQDSMRDASAAIVSSLGGSANMGSPMVAAEGQNAVGTLAALGSAQEQYNEDMAPLLQGEGAGMATRVRSAGAKNANELAMRIAEVQAERARARSGMQMDLAQINNDIRQGRADRSMQLRQYNDQLQQQGFQNQLAMGEAQIAAVMADAQLRGLGSSSSRPSTSYPFGKAPQSVRSMAMDDAVASIDGMPYPQALQTVNQILRGYGWSLKNPAVLAMRNNILAQAGIEVDPRTP